ncbi:MAG: putative 3-oxoacyl-[acyl-carrier protein] reductase [Rhizobacter sp.]|nr:putative 3-oxoacyl-[acyl-carrier protein] reductase [Rhizobacter sp.]
MANVADVAAVEAWVAEVGRRLGPVRILHRNAAATCLSGSGMDDDVATMSTDVRDTTMAVNVRGPMLTRVWRLEGGAGGADPEHRRA